MYLRAPGPHHGMARAATRGPGRRPNRWGLDAVLVPDMLGEAPQVVLVELPLRGSRLLPLGARDLGHVHAGFGEQLGEGDPGHHVLDPDDAGGLEVVVPAEHL